MNNLYTENRLSVGKIDRHDYYIHCFNEEFIHWGGNVKHYLPPNFMIPLNNVLINNVLINDHSIYVISKESWRFQFFS